MISDTLHDAAAEIRDYLRDYPHYYKEIEPRLIKLLEDMDSLRRELDRPPPDDGDDSIIRTIDPTIPYVDPRRRQ